MRALALNCTLKRSPEASNTEALARVVLDALGRDGVETELIRVVDRDVPPGVSSDEGGSDEWPAIRERILASQILVIASPTWLGQPSSIAKRVLERMDAMLSEKDDESADRRRLHRARTVMDLLEQRTRAGPSFLEEGEGHDWSRSTGEAAASNLLSVAHALEASPIPPPPS